MHEILFASLILIGYFAVMVVLALLLKKLCGKTELYRKFLHFVLLGSLLVWTLAFNTWYFAVASAVAFAVVVFFILLALQNTKLFKNVVMERKNGEFKISLLIVFFMYAVVTSVCWGWLHDRLLALCCIYAWGIGDAFAALIGKRFGKHFLQGKLIEGKKSVEGSTAMFVCAFISVLVILIIRGGMTWYAYLVISFVTAVVSAVVELFSRHGNDTITCPFAAMSVILPLTYLFGGLVV